jgi:hypothetical protein
VEARERNERSNILLVEGTVIGTVCAILLQILAPFIVVAPSTPAAWSKVGSSTTTEMPMYQTSYSFNVTVPSGTKLLVLGISTYDAGAVTGATFNSAAMSLAVDTYTVYLEQFRAQVWYISNPAVGTYSVALTFSEQITNLVAGASCFDGIATTSPVRDTGVNGGTSTSPSTSVDGAQAGDLIIGVAVANGATLTTADTEDWVEYHDADNIIGGGIRKLATGASMTTSWTSGNVDWYAACVAFKLN